MTDQQLERRLQALLHGRAATLVPDPGDELSGPRLRARAAVASQPVQANRVPARRMPARRVPARRMPARRVPARRMPSRIVAPILAAAAVVAVAVAAAPHVPGHDRGRLPAGGSSLGPGHPHRVAPGSATPSRSMPSGSTPSVSDRSGSGTSVPVIAPGRTASPRSGTSGPGRSVPVGRPLSSRPATTTRSRSRADQTSPQRIGQLRGGSGTQRVTTGTTGDARPAGITVSSLAR